MFYIGLYRENIKNSCLKPLGIDIMYVASSSEPLPGLFKFIYAPGGQKLPHPGFNIRTSDSLNEGLPIKMTREKFQRKIYFSITKIVALTLELATKAIFSLDK